MAIPLIPAVSALIQVVPSIAKWIGGEKAEQAAEQVASIARQVTGMDSTGDAVDSINADPEKKLEFLLAIENNRLALDSMYLKDVQDARANHKHSKVPALIVVSLTLMVAATGWALFTQLMPVENETLSNIIFGALMAKWSDSIAYFVGSSRGSAAKNK